MSVTGKQIALISCPETPDEIREHIDAYVDAVANLQHESFLHYLKTKLLPVVLHRMEAANLRGAAPKPAVPKLELEIHQLEVVGARDEEKETELAWILPLITEQDFVEVLGQSLSLALLDQLIEHYEQHEEDMMVDGEVSDFDGLTAAIRYHLLPYMYAFYELAKTGVVVGLAFDPATDETGKELELEGNGVTDGVPAIWVYSPLERLYYVYDVSVAVRA